MGNAANLCHFAGRVSKDPEIKQYQGNNGQFSKARFSIAVDRALTAEQRNAVRNAMNAGQTSDIQTCDFIDLEATGAMVDKIIAPYCVKGKACLVTCHYNSYSYTDQQTGQKKYGHSFIVDDITFAPQDAKGLQNNGNGGQQQQGGYQQNNYQQPQGNYQQNNYQQNNYQQQQAPQNNQRNNAALSGFAMFDDNDQPF